MLGALLTVGAYDVKQVSAANERLNTIVQTEQRIETQNEAQFRDLDKEVARLQEKIEHPHLHGVPCLCEGLIGGKQEKVWMSPTPDCDARMIADLGKVFPGLRCRPDE
jgi:hypothetical protein